MWTYKVLDIFDEKEGLIDDFIAWIDTQREREYSSRFKFDDSQHPDEPVTMVSKMQREVGHGV